MKDQGENARQIAAAAEFDEGRCVERVGAIRASVAADALRRLARQLRAAAQGPLGPPERAIVIAERIEAAEALFRIAGVASTPGDRASRQARTCHVGGVWELGSGKLLHFLEGHFSGDVLGAAELETWAAEWDEWAAERAPDLALCKAFSQTYLDGFLKFLNERYADALRAFRRGGPGLVHVLIHPRGRRNARHTLFVVRFAQQQWGARILGEPAELKSPVELRQRLAELVLTEGFRSEVATMRALAEEPVEGVLRAGGVLDQCPSTDVLVTISTEEQARLAASSESTREAITLRVHLEGPTPPAMGRYAAGAEFRLLLAGGYALALDAGGHVLEDADVVRLTGTPVDPEALEREILHPSADVTISAGELVTFGGDSMLAAALEAADDEQWAGFVQTFEAERRRRARKLHPEGGAR